MREIHEYTTIRIRPQTRDQLAQRGTKQETYDEIITRILKDIKPLSNYK